MRSKNIVLSAFVLISVVLSQATFTFARFDEGMFAPGQIAGLPLKKKGLKIRPEDIYNPGGRRIDGRRYPAEHRLYGGVRFAGRADTDQSSLRI